MQLPHLKTKGERRATQYRRLFCSARLPPAKAATRLRQDAEAVSSHPRPNLFLPPAYQLTSSSHVQLSPQELREVVTAFNDTNEPKAVQATGLHLAGEKYFVIKADEKSLYGKKVRINQPKSPDLEGNVSSSGSSGEREKLSEVIFL
jgi:Profilin